MERGFTPPLLPVFRSQQQAELLTLLLANPDLELSLTDLARRTRTPTPSVHREVERAESVGIVRSRRVGNVRLVRADTSSPYYQGLADVLTKAFGVPAVLAESLAELAGISRAFVFGSWAAQSFGDYGKRPLGDIDLLVLGDPNRDELYEAIHLVETRLGRPVQIIVREDDWIELGSGSFHLTVTSGPLVEVELADRSSSTARQA